MTFKISITVEGKCIDDLFRLPCVRSIEKAEGGVKLRMYPLLMARPSQFLCAYNGDVLAEDDDNLWHIIRNGFEV